MAQFRYQIRTLNEQGIICISFGHAEGCAMPDLYFKGRPVYAGNICYGIEIEDTYLEDACYADTLVDVDPNDLDTIGKQYEEKLYEGYWEYHMGRAEAWANRYK